MPFGKNLKDDFGAIGNGASPTQDTAAFNAAIAAGPGTYFIPKGDYLINAPLAFHRRRGMRFIGEGGDAVTPATQIRWVGASSGTLISLMSCLNIAFEHILFYAETSCERLILADAFNAPDISSHQINFDRCSFSRNTANAVPILVRMSNTVFASFNGCWLFHCDTAIFAGTNAADSPNTIAKGAVNQLQVRNSYLNCDVFLRQTLHATFENNVWDNKFADGKIPVIAGNSGDQDNDNIRVVQNFSGLIDPGAGNKRPFVIQGTQGRGLIAENNSVRFASTAFDLTGQGRARLSANRPINSDQFVDLHGNAANCIVDVTNN